MNKEKLYPWGTDFLIIFSIVAFNNLRGIVFALSGEPTSAIFDTSYGIVFGWIIVVQRWVWVYPDLLKQEKEIAKNKKRLADFEASRLEYQRQLREYYFPVIGLRLNKYDGTYNVLFATSSESHERMQIADNLRLSPFSEPPIFGLLVYARLPNLEINPNSRVFKPGTIVEFCNIAEVVITERHTTSP